MLQLAASIGFRLYNWKPYGLISRTKETYELRIVYELGCGQAESGKRQKSKR